MIKRYSSGDRAAWLARRVHLLNASEIGALVGVHPYKTGLGLWAEKSGLYVPPQEDNVMMQRGRWLECAGATALRDRHPDWKLRYPLDIHFVDTERRTGATPDSLAEIDGELVNVQIKVVAPREFDRQWANGPPLHIELQTLSEGMHVDADRSIIAALIVGDYIADLRLFEVPRHAAAERRLQDIAAAFWDRVNTGRRPPAEPTRDAPTVAAMFPVAQPEPVLDLSGDNRLITLLPKRETLKAVITRAEKRAKEIDDEIKCRLAEAETARLDGWKITWKTQTRAEHVVAASSFRQLRITRSEEDAA